jgi:DNA-binding CsgD family transcriptional regulator
MTTPIDLDDRELAIIKGYAKGLTDKKIAASLGDTRPAISGAGARMRRRLGANDRAHTVGIAYETGILTPGAK